MFSTITMPTLRFDGGSRQASKRAGCGAALYSDDETELDARYRTLPFCTNNVAEYEGLILGLQLAILKDVAHLRVEGDSMLVINQMKGSWKINYEHLRLLHQKARELCALIPGGCEFYHIYRDKNKRADALANEAMDAPPIK